MKWHCPQSNKARQKGCIDIKEDGSCVRKEWSDVSYFKTKGPDAQSKTEVHCERIGAKLREE